MVMSISFSADPGHFLVPSCGRMQTISVKLKLHKNNSLKDGLLYDFSGLSLAWTLRAGLF